jgi:hypothetical protein
VFASPHELPSSAKDVTGAPLSTVQLHTFVPGSQATLYVWPLVCSWQPHGPIAPSLLALAEQEPEEGAPASWAWVDDPPGGPAWEKHSMSPLPSVVQQSAGSPPCGVCQPGGQEGHAVAGSSGQLHGGHAPSESHAQTHELPEDPELPEP